MKNPYLSKGSEEWLLWQDLYKFRSEFYLPDKPNDDDFWQEVTIQADVIAKKYANCKCAALAQKLVLTLCEDIERRTRKSDA